MSDNLVLLPGLLCDHRQWEAQITYFGDKFKRIVPIRYAEKETITDIASEVIADLDRMNIGNFHLAGLSMGGIVAFELIRKHRERIKSLVLLDTNPARDDETKASKRKNQMERCRQNGLEGLIRDELKPAMIYTPNFAAVAGRVMQMGLETGERAFMTHQKALLRRTDSTPTLARIFCKTLLICGREDGVCPPVLHRKMAAAIPKSRFAEIPLCGHLSTLECPEAVNGEMQRHFEELEHQKAKEKTN